MSEWTSRGPSPALVERVLRFNPSDFPAMDAAAVECSLRDLQDPVELLDCCATIANVALRSVEPLTVPARHVLGVDPGLSGGWAIVTLNGELVEAVDLPTIGTGTQRRIDAANLAALVRARAPARAVLEAASARPGNGVSSMFRYGQAFGTVAGIIGALGIPVSWATPSSWKKDMSLNSDGERSRQAAVERWPQRAALFSRKADHHRAEAALLALWETLP